MVKKVILAWSVVFCAVATFGATLTLSVNDSTRGTVSGGGAAGADGIVTALASAAEGYAFVCWKGTLPVEVDAASAEISFALAADTSLEAVFGKVYDVAPEGNASGEGGGVFYCG